MEPTYTQVLDAMFSPFLTVGIIAVVSITALVLVSQRHPSKRRVTDTDPELAARLALHGPFPGDDVPPMVRRAEESRLRPSRGLVHDHFRGDAA